jgi:hypothetical protein
MDTPAWGADDDAPEDNSPDAVIAKGLGGAEHPAASAGKASAGIAYRILRAQTQNEAGVKPLPGQED